jgi:hypothetical protein
VHEHGHMFAVAHHRDLRRLGSLVLTGLASFGPDPLVNLPAVQID